MGDKHKEGSPDPRPHFIRRDIFLAAATLLFLILITVFFVLYARGYRIGLGEGKPSLSKTGILHTVSVPKGAQVYVNGHLTTATDNSVNLSPGEYAITIAKDGYNDWQKNVKIETEVVSNADARLFPKAPTLQGIATFGIESPVVDPTGTKLAFTIASQSSALKNGVYVLDMTKNGFPVLAAQTTSTLLANDTVDTFSHSTISWSPDGLTLIASISGELSPTYYLLKADRFNDAPQDVTLTLDSVMATWNQLQQEDDAARLKTLKPAVQKFMKQNFRVIAWSPDASKILYQASGSAEMPVFIRPRRIGNNWLYERRDIKKGAIYVYNAKEDVNTRVIDSIDLLCPDMLSLTNCRTPFTWFPDSDHLVYVHDSKIAMVEDDGSNLTVIYAGPFVQPFVYPWPDASKLVIMTNLGNTSNPPTLYTIGLK